MITKLTSTIMQAMWQYTTQRDGQGKLAGQQEPYSIYEDTESMFYVILYCGLLHLPHDMDFEVLTNMFKTVFDSWSPETDRSGYGPRGGAEKRRLLEEEDGLKKILWGDITFRDWLTTFQQAYKNEFAQSLDAYVERAINANTWAPDYLIDRWAKIVDRNEISLDNRKNHIDLRRVYMRKVAPIEYARRSHAATSGSPAQHSARVLKQAQAHLTAPPSTRVLPSPTNVPYVKKHSDIEHGMLAP